MSDWDFRVALPRVHCAVPVPCGESHPAGSELERCLLLRRVGGQDGTGCEEFSGAGSIGNQALTGIAA